MMATIAYDTAVITFDRNIDGAVHKEEAMQNVSNWTKRWYEKINVTKSMDINFKYKKITNLPRFNQ